MTALGQARLEESIFSRSDTSEHILYDNVVQSLQKMGPTPIPLLCVGEEKKERL